MTAAVDEATFSKLLQEIVAGRRDDQLDDLSSAIAARVKESMLTFAWRFTLNGVSVGELDVTLDEWSEIQRIAGVHFSQLSPELQVDHLRAIGRVLLATRGQLSDDEAAEMVGKLTARDVPTVVTREVQGAPFDSPTPDGTSPTSPA